MGRLRPHCLVAGGPGRCARLLSDAEPGALLSYAVRCSGPLDLTDASQANDMNTVLGTSFWAATLIFSALFHVFLKRNESFEAGWENHLVSELADNFCFVFSSAIFAMIVD